MIRSYEASYSYHLSFQHVVGDYSILSFNDGFNYQVDYVLSRSSITDPNELIDHSDRRISSVSLTQLNQHLAIGASAVMDADITVLVDLSGCRRMKYTCFLLRNTERGSFTEVNLQNNVHCEPMLRDKLCSPRKFILIRCYISYL